MPKKLKKSHLKAIREFQEELKAHPNFRNVKIKKIIFTHEDSILNKVPRAAKQKLDIALEGTGLKLETLYTESDISFCNCPDLRPCDDC